MNAEEAQTITRVAELEEKHALALIDINERIRSAAYAKSKTTKVIYNGNVVNIKDVEEYAEILRERRGFQVSVEHRNLEIELVVSW